MSLALTHPCPEGVETDAFGWREAIPGTVGAQLHTGQDYKADTWTPVYAAHAGRVNRVWWDTFADGSGAGGNMLQIGAAQVSTRYAHLVAYNVAYGADIQAGDLIGWVGSTGAATGPHLHFEVILPGGFTDPRPYLRGDLMTPQQLAQILAAIRDVPRATLDTRIKVEGTDKTGKPRTGTTSLRENVANDHYQIGITRRLVEAIKKKLRA